jgi:hypothetical protein
VKGIIFNLVEEVVSAAHGNDAWDTMLDAAGLDGAYTSLGSYPDDDLMRLVAAASAALGASADDVIRQIGQGALPLLAERYNGFFDGHSSTRSFLLTLNDIIHPEVLKLYPGAVPPNFSFESNDDGSLTMGYKSERRLCRLAEGFILGAASHYGEEVELDQPQCMHRGDDQCVIRCQFRAVS